MQVADSFSLLAGRLGSAVLLLGGVACGETVDHGTSPGDAGADMGAPDSAGSDSVAPSYVSFTNNPAGGYFAAEFSYPSEPCPQPTPYGDGACVVRQACTRNAYDGGPIVQSAPFANAGTLTITGTTSGTTPVTRSIEGSYGAKNAGPIFVPGATLGVAASGAVFPAFARQTITGPAIITLVAPQQPYAISTTADLAVAWTGGEPGAQVIFQVGGSGPGEVDCTFDASVGHGTVPAAALRTLSGMGWIGFGQLASTTFTAGGYPVQLTALTDTEVSATFQ